MSWRRFVHLLMAASLALAAVSLWRRDSLPPPEKLRAEIAGEPLQTQISVAPFDTRVGGVTYSVRPLYEYDLHGVVVSRHDAKTFWDYVHAEWNDHLNVVDLCVVWGRNADRDVADRISFSSGEFICYYETRSSEAYAAFDPAKFANNHLLTDDPGIARRLRNARVGDQVRFRGYLAEYSHNHGFPFKRGTSVTRTDSGNGACETVFVTDFELLREGGGPWRRLLWIALALLGVGVVLWWFLPVGSGDRE